MIFIFCCRRLVWLTSLVIPGVLSQFSPLLAWLSPRVRSISTCEGTCQNLLVCSLTGGR